MITAEQTRTIILLSSGQGVRLTESDVFSLTAREAARIIRRLRAA